MPLFFYPCTAVRLDVEQTNALFDTKTMKTFIHIVALSAGVAALTSCKKDFTCTCVTNLGTERTVFTNIKKVEAEDACQALDAVATLDGGVCRLD